METIGITSGQQRIQVLGFADDLNTVKGSIEDIWKEQLKF